MPPALQTDTITSRVCAKATMGTSQPYSSQSRVWRGSPFIVVPRIVAPSRPRAGRANRPPGVRRIGRILPRRARPVMCPGNGLRPAA